VITDREMMLRAVELARGGFPAPNPRVGCVIVRDGAVVGEGYHDHHGGPHAEVVALGAAKERARSGTAYVTLEPCAHYGRTPPCTDALIQAGMAKVVYAVQDPNPKAAGGAAVLQGQGIVVEHLTTPEAEEVNRIFLHAQHTGRPYVIAKLAMTLDGYIARPDGTSKWITGEEARAEGHRLRAEMGAVLVGASTAAIDRPQLTARIPGVLNQPARYVLDPQGRVKDFPGETLRETQIEALLQDLRSRGHIGLLVEGGAKTVAGFLEADLVDEIWAFQSPDLFGDGITAWPPRKKSGQQSNFLLHEVRRVGRDALTIWRKLP